MMILDRYDYVFVWEGSRATKEEKFETLQVVQYLNQQIGRENQPIYLVKSKNEPLLFTSSFFGWDSKLRFKQSIENLKEVRDILNEYNRCYTYQELKSKPNYVDATKLETYLSEKEFQSLFGCTLEQFREKPSWKQADEKKRLGLF